MKREVGEAPLLPWPKMMICRFHQPSRPSHARLPVKASIERPLPVVAERPKHATGCRALVESGAGRRSCGDILPGLSFFIEPSPDLGDTALRGSIHCRICAIAGLILSGFCLGGLGRKTVTVRNYPLCEPFLAFQGVLPIFAAGPIPACSKYRPTIVFSWLS